uniref:Protein HEXIM1 n=1 Tax=Parastrongyloides trichosuri TaxID=131310 RepID=A0A0N4ZX68_PARTI
MPKRMKSHEGVLSSNKAGSSLSTANTNFGSLSENDAEEMDAVYRERRLSRSGNRRRNGHLSGSKVGTKNGVTILKRRRNIILKRNKTRGGIRRGNHDDIFNSHHQILTPRNDVALVVPRAPYNTNSFLADDIEDREKGKLHSSCFLNLNYRLRCYSLGAVNFSSSIEDSGSEDLSTASDIEDLSEFDREYDNIFMDRLNELSKTQLASEYITLEAKNSVLNAEKNSYYTENLYLKKKLEEQGIQYEDILQEFATRRRTFSGNSDTTDSTLPQNKDNDDGPFCDYKFASQSPVAV